MLALLIFVVTLLLVIWQPRGIGIGWPAAAGALVALALGVVHWADVGVVWHIVWNATFTFVALIVISLILDKAGFFHWAALHVARAGGGRGRRLFPLVVVLGFGIAAVFANDGAALLLTPIVLAILTNLQFSKAAALAFVIATGFVADTTSLPLVISNLVNIVSANYEHIGFGRYAVVMAPVDLVALAASLAVLWWYFRPDFNVRYEVAALPAPGSVIRDMAVFKAAWPLLGGLLLAYFCSAPFNVPVSFITVAGALVLMVVAGRGKNVSVAGVLRQAPWSIVVFSLGMYLVVYGLRNAGLTALAGGVLQALGQHGIVAAAVGTGVLAAGLSSVMNNMPAVLIGVLAVGHTNGLAPLAREAMVYGNVIGCDLGPKFTPMGSLATLLWLHVLAGKGQKIGWGQYMRIGLVITPPVLLVSLLALAAWLQVVG